jgi:hypothetical protein
MASATAPAAKTDTHALGLRLQAIGFAGLLVALIWAPWPLGSNRPWGVALLAAVVWASVLLAVLGQVLNGQPRRSLSPGAWLPVAALVAFAGLAVVQMLPGLGPDGGTLSIDPFHTRRYLLITLLYLGAWLLVLLTIDTRARAEKLLGALLVNYCVDRRAVRAVVAGSSAELYFAFEERSPLRGARWDCYTLPDPEVRATTAALVARGYSETEARGIVDLCGTRLRLLRGQTLPESRRSSRRRALWQGWMQRQRQGQHHCH